METDQELIDRVKEDQDSNSLVEIIERHSGIYHDMVDRFLSGSRNTAERDSLLEDKEFTIYNSVMKYDSSRGAKFATYLANEAKWKCLNTLTRNKKFQKCSLEDILKQPQSEGDLEVHENYEVFSLFKSFLQKEKDKRMEKIIDMRYNGVSNKLTPWRKIAKSLDMSIQGVINIHNRCLLKFKKQSENYV
tara:strand:- start:3088 stop:3657 length:570 start_codon:yes stop_codon:yes gene_type:complete